MATERVDSGKLLDEHKRREAVNARNDEIREDLTAFENDLEQTEGRIRDIDDEIHQLKLRKKRVAAVRHELVEKIRKTQQQVDSLRDENLDAMRERVGDGPEVSVVIEDRTRFGEENADESKGTD